MKKNLILEICQNHNGSESLLKEMIHAASETGAKYVKIQDINSNELTFRPRFEKGEIINKKIITIKRPFEKEYERLKKLDMKKNFISSFVKYCNFYKVIPMITPFTYGSYSRIENKKVEMIKIASYDCSSYNFLNKIKKLKLPMVVSTGATKKNEIIKASKILKKQLYAFLHCVTIYPTPLEKCNLKKINFLKKYCKVVGWSDHTLFERDGHVASLVSLLCGADIIERHFTILNKKKTKDGPVSINFKEAKELTKFMKLSKDSIQKILNEEYSKQWKLCLGKVKTNLSHEELLNRDYYRGRFAKFVNKKPNFNWHQEIL
tara:strand:+ start:1727 stop:2683 length:957 start_codon:yes stop_codon:yes gene_type:complete